MQQVINNIVNKINEQSVFMRSCIYVLVGFLVLLVGYGIGRLIGLVFFGYTP